MQAFLTKFEQLQGFLDHLHSDYVFDKFMDGLKEEIRYYVEASKPTNFKEAVAMAKIFESKYNSTKKSNMPSHYTKSNPYTRTIPSKPIKPVSQTHSIPTRRSIENLAKSRGITLEELIDKRRKNLCYGCNERWHVGYQCKNKQVYILEGIMNLEGEELYTKDGCAHDEEAHENEDKEESPAITFHAMCRIPLLHTIIITGIIQGRQVQILIDSGSTHSLIDEALARRLKLSVDESRRYEVMVANGERLQGDRYM